MKALFFVFSIFISSSALASQFGLIGGLNMAEVKTDLVDGSEKEFGLNIGGFNIGFNIGFRYYSELNSFRFRTGGQISQYNFSFGDEVFFVDRVDSFSLLQLMIPVTAQFSVNEVFSIFGGAGVSIHLSDDSEVDGVYEVYPNNKSIWLTLQLGASVMFNEKTGLEFVFDYGITDLATDTNGKVFALNFVYML